MDDEQLTSIPPFGDRMRDAGPEALRAADIRILQVNLGYRCNMSCKHCHVEAGPDRNELMNKETAGDVVSAIKTGGIEMLDITGGAPEMNPHFRYLVEEARKTGCRVAVRTNLTVFFEDGSEYLPEFISDHSVEVIASLPYYTEGYVDRVRGKGAFEKCIRALRILNGLGYGTGHRERKLNLVYNPPGAFLPPAQRTLEDDYRKELSRGFGVTFDVLYTFANMPIGRFRNFLLRTGGLEKYIGKLVCAFNPETIPGLMCRQLVSIGWDGRLYDCDFNQMLGLTVHNGCPQKIKEFDLSRLMGRTITVGDHCYACTAGQGST